MNTRIEPSHEEEWCRKFIDTICAVTHYTRQEAVDALLTSLRKIGEDNPERSPFYIVCRWLQDHRDLKTYCRTQTEVSKRIAAATGLSAKSALCVLRRRPERFKVEIPGTRRAKGLGKQGPGAGGYEPVEGHEPKPPSTVICVQPGSTAELTIKTAGLEITLKVVAEPSPAGLEPPTPAK